MSKHRTLETMRQMKAEADAKALIHLWSKDAADAGQTIGHRLHANLTTVLYFLNPQMESIRKTSVPAYPECQGIGHEPQPQAPPLILVNT